MACLMMNVGEKVMLKKTWIKLQDRVLIKSQISLYIELDGF